MVVETSGTVVVAIGGNSLVKRGVPDGVATQRKMLKPTVESLATLVAAGTRVVVTHGNGPQVGAALERTERTADLLYRLPLDVVSADVQGGIGYVLQQELGNVVGPERPVATVVTQVVVDSADPAFQAPAKPVGAWLSEAAAREHEAEDGWVVREISARGWRRVVPSPAPHDIVELPALRALLASGTTVICCGGGGIPVVRGGEGKLAGVEGVIDKDATSRLLAGKLGARGMIILTAVDQVCVDFGKDSERALEEMTVGEAQALLSEGQFPPGSMGPKIASAIDFLTSDDSGSTAADRWVLITTPGNLGNVLAGKSRACTVMRA